MRLTLPRLVQFDCDGNRPSDDSDFRRSNPRNEIALMTTAILLDPPAEGVDVLEPSKQIRVRLLWKVDQLQMLPSLAIKALELAKHPDCSIKQFASLIERDLTLASDMLKMANSMVYSRGIPIPSLQQAVVRLGFQQCKNLILASSANSLMMQLTMTETWIREALWRHGFLTATIASSLNRALNLGFQGEEFTAGLVHDIGRILLALLEPSRFSKADRLDCAEDGEATQQEMLQREQALLGTDHCILGSWFLEYSGLPQSLAEVARLHHTYSRELSDRPLVALTAVADHMANHMQLTKNPAGYEPETNSAIDFLARSHSQRRRLIEIIPTVMEEAISNLQVM